MLLSRQFALKDQRFSHNIHAQTPTNISSIPMKLNYLQLSVTMASCGHKMAVMSSMDAHNNQQARSFLKALSEMKGE